MIDRPNEAMHWLSGNPTVSKLRRLGRDGVGVGTAPFVTFKELQATSLRKSGAEPPHSKTLREIRPR